MTLKDYYYGLSDEDRADFKEKVIRRTGRNVVTFYRWLREKNRPSSYNDQKAIARIAGVPVRELFPEKELV
jgi:hypothetical protein